MRYAAMESILLLNIFVWCSECFGSQNEIQNVCCKIFKEHDNSKLAESKMTD